MASESEIGAFRALLASYDSLSRTQLRMLRAVLEIGGSAEGLPRAPVEAVRALMARRESAPIEQAAFRQRLKRLNDSLSDDGAPFELVTEDGHVVVRPTSTWDDEVRVSRLERTLRARSEEALRFDFDGLVEPRAMPRALTVMFSYAWLPGDQQRFQLEFFDRLQDELHRPPQQYRRLPRIDLWRDSLRINPAMETGTAQMDQACRDAFLGILMLSTKYESSVPCLREAGFFLDDEGNLQPGKFCLAMRFNEGLDRISERFKHDGRIIQGGDDGNHILGFWETATEGQRHDFVCRIAGYIFEAADAYVGPPAPDKRGTDTDRQRKETEEFLAKRVSRLQFEEESSVVSFARPAVLGQSLADLAAMHEGGGIEIVEHLVRWATSKRPDRPRLAALLGDFGMGKTVTCQLVTRRLLRESSVDGPVPLPIYFDLRDLEAPKNQADMNLEALIDQLLRQPGEHPPSAREVIAFAQERNSLIIFDGLDEVTNKLPADAARRLYRELLSVVPTDIWVADAARRRHPDRSEGPGVRKGPSLLISCRSQYFSTIAGERGFLTDADRSGLDPQKDIASYVMLPFSEEQVRDYIFKNLDEAQAGRALTLIDETYNLRELATRPILLRYIGEMVDRLEQRKREGKVINISLLYDTLVEQAFERDNPKHSMAIDEKKKLLSSLALYLHRRGQDQIAHDRLREWLRAEIDRSHPHLAKALIGGEGLRLSEIFAQDLRNATLLSRPGEDSFRFGHTSLREYFLAGAYYEAVAAGGAPQVWDAPPPSGETIMFILRRHQIEEAPERAAFERGFPDLLAAGAPAATRATAVRLWAQAVRLGEALPRPDRIDASGLQLKGTVLFGTSDDPLPLRDIDWTGAHFQRVEVRNASLRGSTFADARLLHTTFVNCDLEETDFQGALLMGSRWRNCSIGGDSLSGAALDLTEAEDTTIGGSPWRPQGELPDDAHDWQLELRSHSGFGISLDTGALEGRPVILSAGGDRSVRLWDAFSGTQLRSLPAGGGLAPPVAFVEGGGRTLIAAGAGRAGLDVWDASSGSRLHLLKQDSWVRSLAAAPAGDRPMVLVAGALGELESIDLLSGESMVRFVTETASIEALACAELDGRSVVIVGTAEGQLRVFDIASGDPVLSLEPGFGQITAIAFGALSGRPHLLAASDEGEVAIWDGRGRIVRRFQCEKGKVESLAVCEIRGKNSILTGGQHGISVWDAATGSRLEPLEGRLGWADVLRVIDLGGTHVVVSGDFNGTLHLWHAQSGEGLYSLPGNALETYRVERVGGDRPVLLTCDDLGGVNVLDARGTLIGTMGDPQERVTSLAVCEMDGATVVLTAGRSGRALLWDLDGQTPIRGFASGDEHVEVVDMGSVAGLCFAVTGDREGRIRLWDAASGELHRTIEAAGSAVASLALAEYDGAALVASANRSNGVRLWDASTGTLLHEWSVHSRDVALAAEAGRPVLLSAGSARTVFKWDVASGELLRTFQGPTSWLNSVTHFTVADRSFVLAGGDDGLVWVWDSQSGEVVHALEGHQAQIRGLTAGEIGGETILCSVGTDVGVRIFKFGDFDKSPVGVSIRFPTTSAGLDFVPGATGERLCGVEEQAWRAWQCRYRSKERVFTGSIEDMLRASGGSVGGEAGG